MQLARAKAKDGLATACVTTKQVLAAQSKLVKKLTCRSSRERVVSEILR
jgi:hypothetical protein